MISDKKLVGLRILATEAMHGTWKFSEEGCTFRLDQRKAGDRNLIATQSTMHMTPQEKGRLKKTFKYMASVNPKLILELLDDIEYLQKRLSCSTCS